MLPTLLTILIPTAAAGSAIHGGELAGSLSDSAYTLPAGEKRLQILAPSSFGVRDNLELSSSLLGLLAGPNLAAELGVLSDGGRALSVKPSATWLWSGDLSVGAEAIYTLGGADSSRLTFGGGVGYALASGTGTLTTSVRGGYDLVIREDRLLQFSARVDPYSSIQSKSFAGSIGAGYIWAWDTYRLELGLVSADANEIEVALEQAGQEIDLPAYVPLPYVLMWWRF